MGAGAGSSQIVEMIVVAIKYVSGGTIPPPENQTPMSAPTIVGDIIDKSIMFTIWTIIKESEAYFKAPHC